MHRIGVVAFEGVVLFDLAVPVEVFSRARPPGAPRLYDVRVCGVTDVVATETVAIRAPWPLDELEAVDTVVVPGVDDLDRPLPHALLAALRAAAARGARIVSICSGAFVLAAAGLLEGRRATTHWIAAPELQRRFPKVQVDPSVLYVADGPILTSAGAAAGLDLCLHLVRVDHGAAAAAEAARLSVMPLERDGGQAQFIVHPPPTDVGANLAPVLAWIEAHLDADLAVPALARRAGQSPRTFLRRFKEQTGTTPARWIARARVRRAQVLLETTDASVDAIADATGLGAASTLRERFHAIVGTSPAAYRRAFRGD